MKQIYETIKNAGRRALYAGAVGATLVFGGCSDSAEEKNDSDISLKNYSMRIEDDRESRIQKIIDESNEKTIGLEKLIKKIKICEGDLLENISDGHLSAYEQRKSLLDYQEMLREELSLSEKRSYFHINSQERILYDLLKENVEGLDTGIPELEKELEKRGYKVEVESITSSIESDLPILGVLGPLFCLAALGRYYQLKRQNED